MTTLETTGNGMRIVTDPTAGTYPAWQPGRKFTLANTVGGFSATAIYDIPASEAAGSLLSTCQLNSFIWNGVQFARCPDVGSGSGYEIYLVNSTAEAANHRYNATEPGHFGDSVTIGGRTNLLARALTDATGKNGIRIVDACAWIGPGENVAGLPSLVKAEVLGMINTITYTWGLAGDDHILQIDNSIVIPTDATIQAFTQLSMVPFFHYCPNFGAKPFPNQEWVHMTTGATRAYAADTSTTEVLMNVSADQNFACAVVPGPGLLGTGWNTGFAGAGPFPYTNIYSWTIKTYAGGIPAGTVRAPVGFCFGSRADLIGGGGAVVTAAANLPAAVFP